MEMDLYSACPCGSGKKIKFCCPRQHVTDYLKVFELIEAEQFAAAAELTERLVSKEPRQICFLALKATFLDPVDETATRQMAEQLAAVAPRHPITHAAQALVALHNGDLEQAIDRIQDCIEQLENAVPSLLLTAMSMSAGAALQEGKLATAFAHASYVQILTKGRHTASGELLLGLQRNYSMPPVVHDDWLLRLGHVLGEKLDARLAGLVRRGKWRRARDEAQAHLQRQPDNVGARAILALVQGNLGHDQAAHEAWTQLADAPEFPENLAIDAVLMAESGSRDHSCMLEPMRERVYPLVNTDAAMERLLSDRRAVSSKQDLSSLGDDDSPPPKAVFVLMERPAVEWKEGVQLADLPRALGQLLVYGRQTDRDAQLRVFIESPSDSRFEEVLREILGDSLGEGHEETTLGLTPLLPSRLLPNVSFPEGLPPDQQLEWHRRLLDEAVQQNFPQRPHPLLNEKTPEQAAQDPSLRRRLSAALLWLETTQPFDLWDGDWNGVWNRLGLTRQLDWQPSDEQPWVHGLTQLVRINTARLEDEYLEAFLETASSRVLRHAVLEFAREMTRRPTTRREMDLGPAFEILVNLSSDPAKKLEWVEQAVAWSRERSMPVGRWLVQQVTWEILNGKVAQAQQTLQTIMSRHQHEPGVSQDVYQMLLSFGMITPDGRPVQMPGEAPAAAPPAAAPAGLWTPDQGAPSAAPPTASKLWVPGQE